MSYTTTSRLGLKKAVVGSNQAFETAIFNENLDKVDAEAVAADSRLDAVESTNTSQASALTSLDGRVTTLEGIVGASSALRTVTGTSDTLLVGDKGNTVVYNSATDVTVTLPNILTAGQRIDILQEGVGQVILSAGSGVSIYGVGSKTATRYAGATVLCIASGSYRFVGNIV